MMEDRKHIDGIFKDALYDYDVEPPKYIWEEIKADLASDSKRKRLIVLRSVAASAAIIISFFAGYYLTNQKSESLLVDNLINDEAQTVKTDQQNLTQEPEKETVAIPVRSEVTTQTKKEDIHAVDNSTILTRQPDENTETQIKTASITGTIANDEQEENLNNPVSLRSALTGFFTTENPKRNITIPAKQKMDDLLAYSVNKQLAYADNEEFDQNSKNGKWGIAGNLSPTYTIQNESISKEDLTKIAQENLEKNNLEISQESMLAISGGMKLSYKMFDRLTIQGGLSYSKIGQQINNAMIDVSEIASYDGSQLLINNSYTTTSAIGQIRYNTKDNASIATNQQTDQSEKAILIESVLLQNFEYLEMPFQLKYKVVDRKIDMQMHAGFAPGLLIANRVYLDQEGGDLRIGYTEGMNPIVYRASVGFGIDYPLLDNVSLNFEPTVRYAINSISFNKDIKPYSLGVFTGISYFFN